MNKNLKEIVLPIETKPAVVSRNIHAIHLSIIQKCDKQGINYVYNNYIQLMFKTESSGHITFDYIFPRYKNLSTLRTCSVDKPTFTINRINIVIAYLNSYGNKSVDLIETVSYYHHRIEKELITASLEDYINSDNKSRLFDKSKWLEDNETFGIKTIEKIKLYLDDVINGRVYFDKRVMYTLMEHKRIMLERYEHLLCNGIIGKDETLKKDLSEIYKKSCIGFNLYLKYLVSDNTSSLLKIDGVLDEIRDLEIKAIPRFIDALKKGVN